MSLRSKRFTNTVALLVALRGGLPPGWTRGWGKERERGVQEKTGQGENEWGTGHIR